VDTPKREAPGMPGASFNPPGEGERRLAYA
jgi:hypothetical protein